MFLIAGLVCLILGYMAVGVVLIVVGLVEFYVRKARYERGQW